ncbi:MAG TPA: glycosyltransferase, partial [Xanthomarina sp.]|nr:glycosyltransferase [Xanthomarina sp.]
VKEIQNYPDIAKEKLILNVGRLVPEKGQKYLIEAFSKINEKADWRVVFLGDGFLRSELELQARQLGVEEQVKFLGAVENIDEWLARASVFAFPSISEGFPNALAEAMSAGLPCISFDCNAGPRDLIENNVNGYLVEVGEVDELTQSIKNLMDDEDKRKRFGKKSIKIKNKLLSSSISNKYLKFLLK